MASASLMMIDIHTLRTNLTTEFIVSEVGDWHS